MDALRRTAVTLLLGGLLACSSNSGGPGSKDAGADASADVSTSSNEDAGEDSTTGQITDSSNVGPGLDISLQAPDGCWEPGAYCQGPETCCSGSCEDAQCAPSLHQQ